MCLVVYATLYFKHNQQFWLKLNLKKFQTFP